VNWLFAGRWLLPWLCSLLAAGTVAYAADAGLRRALVSEPAVHVTNSAPIQQPGVDSHWVLLSSVDFDGAERDFACLTGPGLFAADALQLSAADLDRFVSELPCHALAPNPTQ
jgi:hypothetical protein